MTDEKKKKGLFNKLRTLFPSATTEIKATQNTGTLELSTLITSLGQYVNVIEEESKNKLVKALPADRLLQYHEYDKMEEDPICGQAHFIHVNNALTYDEDAGYSIQIESRSNENDPVVRDLKTTFHEWMQEDCKKIASNVAKYGCFGVRPYFKADNSGLDLQRTLTGTEGHPATFKIYDSLGSFAGVYSENQDPNHLPKLGEAWQFVIFKSPNYGIKTGYKSRRVHPTDPGYVFDIWDDNPPVTLNESFDYGKSIFQKAYTPWKNLDEAWLALLVARLKSAQRETFVGYPVSHGDPLTSAKELRELTDLLQARDDQDSKRSLKEDLVRISRKIMLPFDASGKGQLVFNQIDPNINIEGIQDLMFTIKILCGSLGVDPSLVGFSDMMSGGLGEGGWLRTSILATSYGVALRQALRNGLERLIEIHVKLRWGKIYTPDQKPWRIKFKAISDAKEREANDVRMGNIDFGERLTNLMMSMEDQEGGPKFDRNVFKNVLLSNILKMEEPVVAELVKLSAKPTEKIEEDAENFNDFPVEEKINFVESQVTNYLEELNVA